MAKNKIRGFNHSTMISPLNFYSQNNQLASISPSFRANLNSAKLKFNQEDFFIRIKDYGRNRNWARVVKDTADMSVKLVREKCDFDSLMRYITAGVIRANQFVFDLKKKEHTGILRAKRPYYKYGSNWDGYLLATHYDSPRRYQHYQERLDLVRKKPLINPFYQIDLTRPKKDRDGSYLLHADSDKVNAGMNLVKNKYENLLAEYIPEKVSQKDLLNIVDKISEIRWILAHITPWERGSDAISNVFMRTLLKAFGIKASQSIKDVSFDMEAYCTNLKDYQKNFQGFFEKPLEVIE